MAKRKLSEKLIKKSDIKEEIRKVTGSVNAYVSENGNVYYDYGNEMFYKARPQIVYGYYYCGITLEKTGKRTSKRVHRLVAQEFIPNPDNLQVVGHKNNIKNDNRVDNLYWTTVQENTQKAYKDRLAKNDKGIEDSQSKQVCQFDLDGNYIRTFGSIREASRITTTTIGAISQQCLHKSGKTKPRKGFYYRFLKEYQEKGFVL